MKIRLSLFLCFVNFCAIAADKQNALKQKEDKETLIVDHLSPEGQELMSYMWVLGKSAILEKKSKAGMNGAEIHETQKNFLYPDRIVFEDDYVEKNPQKVTAIFSSIPQRDIPPRIDVADKLESAPEKVRTRLEEVQKKDREKKSISFCIAEKVSASFTPIPDRKRFNAQLSFDCLAKHSFFQWVQAADDDIEQPTSCEPLKIPQEMRQKWVNILQEKIAEYLDTTAAMSGKDKDKNEGKSND